MNAIRAAVCIVAVLLAPSGSVLSDPASPDLATLGRMLFFDTRLSGGRSQSCASCHDPAQAFVDPRDNGLAGAVSVGADNRSSGNRNAPSLAYASRIPVFHQATTGDYVGGLFLDGRAATLVEQAKVPVTNPVEMALPDAAAVRERMLEDDAYAPAFETLLGPASLATPENALQSLATAIAAFERGEDFATFDSKYDRYLRGETALTADEETGRRLFFSQMLNCGNCHLLDRRESAAEEVFTNHGYRNIGVPPNPAVRERNGASSSDIDTGLLQNPGVSDAAQAGRFRVPSLRNVAVTGPYMHNGVFHELETAIAFYNRFLLGGDAARINPETGQPWGDPEVPDTIDFELLETGQPLTPQRIRQLAAFLRTLTDARYEELLTGTALE